MKRWWVVLALLLSLGVNLGLLAAVAGGWWAERGRAADEAAPAADATLPGPGSPRRGDGPPGGGPPPGWQGPPLERLADHLGLEGATRERFLELQRDFVASVAEARRRRLELGRRMRAELTSPQPDPERVESLAAEMGEVFTAAERATAEVILETRDLLDDPEQERRYLGVLERLRGAGPPAAEERRGPRFRRGRRFGAPPPEHREERVPPGL